MLQYALFYPQFVLFIILCKYINPHSLQYWYCDTVKARLHMRFCEQNLPQPLAEIGKKGVLK